MTRTEFIRAYAARSGLSDKWAVLGYIAIGESVLVALPCECDDEGCEGWAMVSAESVPHHLAFSTPEPMRSAYREILRRTGSPP